MAHLRTDTGQNAHFARVPNITRSRNSFSITEKHVTTLGFDKLYPMYWKYIYPGDTLNIDFRFQARLQTQIAVLYDDLYVDVHAWYCPFRLLQTNWARFQYNTEEQPQQDNSALTTPSIDLASLGSGGFPSKSLYDYFGFPTLINMTSLTSEHINNYLARMYNLTWNLNYRDQNLQQPVTVDLTEGPDDPADYVLLNRGKRHDRFTSSLPFQQKGPAVTIPLGTRAPVFGQLLTQANRGHQFQIYDTGSSVVRTGQISVAAGTDTLFGGTGLSPTATSQGLRLGTPANYGSDANILANAPYADLTAATAATLNVFRQSVAVQHLLEADARSGTRDIESVQSRWGVTIPDYRINRPEYLGGATSLFDGNIVPQTSETDQTPQGTLVQFSENMANLKVIHSFVEAGAFMILLSCRSNITYQQGLLKELSYKTRFDFYQPEFANLGEVAQKKKELFFQANDTINNEPFGYNEYGYELRYGLNRVSSEMRSNFPQSLDTKHMADDYATAPELGPIWIESNTPISRNIAVAANVADPIEINTLTIGTISRTLPMYSVPGLSRL